MKGANPMLRQETFEVYEYPIKHPNGSIYTGSYTIKKGVKPLGYKGEKLVQTFSAMVGLDLRELANA